MADFLLNLLKSNVDLTHGVINVRAVVTELDNQKKDPAEEFIRLFSDPESSAWRFYAMVGMRSLADRGRLKKEQAQKLLEMTETLVQARMSMEEYYKTISALASTKETALVLVDFVQQKLEKKEPPQWRWLAFVAAGDLLQTRKVAIPSTVVKKLLEEVPNEPEPQQKRYLQEIANAAQKVFGLP